MQLEVKVPQLSESVSEATLVAWRKKPGEAVKRDENLIDIETDKVVLELPAPSDGVIVKILKNDGDSVQSGDVIAVLTRTDLSLATVHVKVRRPDDTTVEEGDAVLASGEYRYTATQDVPAGTALFAEVMVRDTDGLEVYQELRQPGVSVLRGSGGAHECDHVVTDMCVGGPDLAPVYLPTAGYPFCAGADGGEVGTGVRFAQPDTES